VSKGKDWSSDSRLVVYIKEEGELASDGGGGAGRGAMNVSNWGGKKAPRV
jgi:hypothetical protein